jgi:hypothetical protein
MLGAIDPWELEVLHSPLTLDDTLRSEQHADDAGDVRRNFCGLADA